MHGQSRSLLIYIVNIDFSVVISKWKYLTFQNSITTSVYSIFSHFSLNASYWIEFDILPSIFLIHFFAPNKLSFLFFLKEHLQQVKFLSINVLARVVTSGGDSCNQNFMLIFTNNNNIRISQLLSLRMHIKLWCLKSIFIIKCNRIAK